MLECGNSSGMKVEWVKTNITNSTIKRNTDTCYDTAPQIAMLSERRQTQNTTGLYNSIYVKCSE